MIVSFTEYTRAQFFKAALALWLKTNNMASFEQLSPESDFDQQSNDCFLH